MTTKYHKYTLKGELSADEAKKSIGDAVSQSLVVRIEKAGGNTHLYTATEDSGKETGAKKSKATAKDSKIKVEEVSEADVTNIG